MKWNQQTADIIGKYWEAGKTDAEIAQIMQSTVISIGKIRSIFGYVKYKRSFTKLGKRLVAHRAKTTLGGTLIAYSDLQAKNHFIHTNGDFDVVTTLANKIMLNNSVKEVTIFQPMGTLKRQNDRQRHYKEGSTISSKEA